MTKISLRSPNSRMTLPVLSPHISHWLNLWYFCHVSSFLFYLNFFVHFLLILYDNIFKLWDANVMFTTALFIRKHNVMSTKGTDLIIFYTQAYLNAIRTDIMNLDVCMLTHDIWDEWHEIYNYRSKTSRMNNDNLIQYNDYNEIGCNSWTYQAISCLRICPRH